MRIDGVVPVWDLVAQCTVTRQIYMLHVAGEITADESAPILYKPVDNHMPTYHMNILE